MTALFGDRIDDPPDIKMVDLWVCKMRQKLKPFGITIDTVWSSGHKMPEKSI
jgi:two-component system cell cycle response regulator CtrA